MKFVFVTCLCIASAFADVSELLQQPVPHHLEQQQHEHEHLQDVVHPSPVEHQSEAIHVEKHVSFDLGLANEGGIEIKETFDVLPVPAGGHVEVEVKSVQLTEEHKDYQGPYHYETPKVQLKAAVPSESIPEVQTSIASEPSVNGNYLPPRLDALEGQLAKRHIPYVIQRRA